MYTPIGCPKIYIRHELRGFRFYFPLRQLVLDSVVLTRTDSVEMLKKPETPGRGVSRKGSLFRCNSIIDGTDLEVKSTSFFGWFGFVFFVVFRWKGCGTWTFR